MSEAQTMVQQALALYDAMGDLRRVATCIEAVAVLASARGDAAPAARLFGASARLYERVGVPIPRHDRLGGDGSTTRAWAPEKATVAASWAEGRALTLEQAVAEALDWTNDAVRHSLA